MPLAPGKQGDYTQFMAQYGQGADAEGDYQKYMSGYQQYMQGQGGNEGLISCRTKLKPGDSEPT